MSIVKLHQEGLVSLTVSQNVDGLHRRSNVDPKFLAELHGNTNLERCKKCGHEYMRDYRTRTSKRVFNHETGRKCDDPKCRGVLLDSIVNFGEDLPEHELDKAEEGALKVCGHTHNFVVCVYICICRIHVRMYVCIHTY